MKNYYKEFLFNRNISLTDFLLIIAFFWLGSLPSIKLFYSSELVNLVPVAIFSIVFLLKRKILVTKGKVWLLFFWILFSTAILGRHLFSDLHDPVDSLRLIYYILVIFLVIVCSGNNIINRLPYPLIFWGLFVALYSIVKGFNYSGEIGQTYLTVSLPIGLALCLSFAACFSYGTTLYKRLFFLLVSIICIYALSMLKVRGMLIFSGIVIFVYLFFYIVLSKNVNVIYRLISLLLIVFSIFLLLNFLIPLIEFSQLYRLERLLYRTHEEPRLEIYLNSFKYINDNLLFGLGISKTREVIGIYPHNIFLDVFLAAGIIGFIPFLIIVLRWSASFFYSLRYMVVNKERAAIGVAGLLLFMQWNTSFDLSTSYIPLSIMLLLVGSEVHTHKNLV